jgi:ribosome-associated translation inhibitor RaiA
MRQITQFDNENRKHRIEIDLKLKSIVENLRIAATMKMLNECYYLEEDGGDIPHSVDEIKELLESNTVKLSTRIKLGSKTNKFKTISDFEEFNQKFKDFL